jgi:hypothetical protein
VALAFAGEAVWSTLVVVRLAEVGEDGWLIHDYTDWNPSAKTVKAARARKAKNTKDFRSRSVTGDVTGDRPGESPPRNRLVPGPSSSLPSPSSFPITETKMLAAADLERRAPVAPASAIVFDDPDMEAVRSAIAAEPRLQRVPESNIIDIVKRTVGVGKRQPRIAYLKAVSDAAAETLEGELSHETLRRLHRFLRNALPPRNVASITSQLTPEQQAQWDDERRRIREFNSGRGNG